MQKYPKFEYTLNMHSTSLQLSPEELQIFTDKIFFQRKSNITKIVVLTLEKLLEQLKTNEVVQDLFSQFHLDPHNGKISKGENYLGCPWQILDYPRLFKKENVFAFRTLCWWGNYYSCTIQLSGSYLQQCRKRIEKNLSLKSDPNLFICVNNDPWQHHFEKNNYILVSEVLQDEVLFNSLTKKNFIKLSCKFPLTKIDQLEKKAFNTLQLFQQIITHTLPDQ